MNVRNKNVLTGPDVPNGKKVCASINEAKRISRQLQASGKVVTKAKN